MTHIIPWLHSDSDTAVKKSKSFDVSAMYGEAKKAEKEEKSKQEKVAEKQDGDAEDSDDDDDGDMIGPPIPAALMNKKTLPAAAPSTGVSKRDNDSDDDDDEDEEEEDDVGVHTHTTLYFNCSVHKKFEGHAGPRTRINRRSYKSIARFNRRN